MAITTAVLGLYSQIRFPNRIGGGCSCVVCSVRRAMREGAVDPAIPISSIHPLSMSLAEEAGRIMAQEDDGGLHEALNQVAASVQALLRTMDTCDCPLFHLTQHHNQSMFDFLTTYNLWLPRWRGSLVVSATGLFLATSMAELSALFSSAQPVAPLGVLLSLFDASAGAPSHLHPLPPTSGRVNLLSLPHGTLSDLVGTVSQNLEMHLPSAIVGGLTGMTKEAVARVCISDEEKWSSSKRLDWLLGAVMSTTLSKLFVVAEQYKRDDWLRLEILMDFGSRKEAARVLDLVSEQLERSLSRLGIGAHERYFAGAFALAADSFVASVDERFKRLLSPTERAERGLAGLSAGSSKKKEEKRKKKTDGSSLLPAISLIRLFEEQVRREEAAAAGGAERKRVKMPASTPNWTRAMPSLTGQDIAWLQHQLGWAGKELYDLLQVEDIPYFFSLKDTVREFRGNAEFIVLAISRPKRPEYGERKGASAAQQRNYESRWKVFPPASSSSQTNADRIDIGADPNTKSIFYRFDSGDDSVATGRLRKEKQYTSDTAVIWKAVLDEPLRAQAAARAEFFSQNEAASRAQDAVAQAAKAGGQVAAANARAANAFVLASAENSDEILRMRYKTKRAVKRKRQKEVARVERRARRNRKNARQKRKKARIILHLGNGHKSFRSGNPTKVWRGGGERREEDPFVCARERRVLVGEEHGRRKEGGGRRKKTKGRKEERGGKSRKRRKEEEEGGDREIHRHRYTHTYTEREERRKGERKK